MTKLFFSVFLNLMALLAHAAESTEIVPEPEASYWPMIVFAIIFVGMVGGFSLYVWFKERERKRRERDRS